MLHYTLLDTPVGVVLLLGKDGELTEVRIGQDIIPPDDAVGTDHFDSLACKLRAYFIGEAVDFSDVPLCMPELGDYEQLALRETMRIPHGRLTTYRAIAEATGSPRAARAVGNAMRKNPFPIIVPCHRVIHSDGTISGYAFGLDMKRKLLALEGIDL